MSVALTYRDGLLGNQEAVLHTEPPAAAPNVALPQAYCAYPGCDVLINVAGNPATTWLLPHRIWCSRHNTAEKRRT